MHKTAPPHAAAEAPTADTQDSRPSPDSARCTAATLYLMSHYAQRPCPLVAHAVADQLKYLSRSCAGGSSLLLQSLAAALLPRWRHIACGSAGAARH